MDIKFHSTVIIVNDFEKMKRFYCDVLHQTISVDFGGCIGLSCGVSLWKLTDEYTIAQKLRSTYNSAGNRNLEICFESDNFDVVVAALKEERLEYLHEVIEERWGQRTIRFYDPEKNLIELGESIPCFVKRFFATGLSLEEVAERTSVPLDMVKSICVE